MNQTVDLQPAYVLHTRDYRDTSLLVDLLTLDHGVVRVVARGIRGKRSGRRAILQALQPLLVSFTGKGELKTLTHFEAAASNFNLERDRLFSAIYINELLCRLLQPYEAHPAIYRLYQSTLFSLMQHFAIEAVLRRFEFGLLKELGYAPDMLHEADSGEAVQSAYWYEFDYLRGFIRDKRGQSDSAGGQYSGADILALGQILSQSHERDFAAHLMVCAKRFMRQALRPHLGNKPLHSRQLFISKSSTATTCLPPDTNTG